MRRLAFMLVLLVALVVPVAASADVPPAAVAACQAKYAQLGADGFLAKYGSTEPWGHCYAQHATTAPTTDDPAVAACKGEYVQLGPAAFAAKYGTPETFGNCVKAHTSTSTSTQPATLPPPPPPTDNPAVAACKAESVKLGADAFAAKYGGTEALGRCVRLHTTQKPEQPATGDLATSVAVTFCQSLAKTLGKAAFLAKYGPTEALGRCVKSSLASAKSLVASCTVSSGAGKDAFRACLAAALRPQPR
jgi:hypothetical protein